MIKYIILFFVFALFGTGSELAYGSLWSLNGITPWIYPNSSLVYTSLEMIPLWGCGGLACVGIYKALEERTIRYIPIIIIPLILAGLWVLAYVQIRG